MAVLDHNPIPERRSGPDGVSVDVDTVREFTGNTYECRVLLCPEPEGGFSAHAIRLGGVVSEGDSIKEALDNIREAFAGAIEVYNEIDSDIPWSDVTSVPCSSECIERWILVNV